MRKSFCNVTVVVPSYNERNNLPGLVTMLAALDLGLRVLVVDDNSPDGTGDMGSSSVVLSCFCS